MEPNRKSVVDLLRDVARVRHEAVRELQRHCAPLRHRHPARTLLRVELGDPLGQPVDVKVEVHPCVSHSVSPSLAQTLRLSSASAARLCSASHTLRWCSSSSRLHSAVTVSLSSFFLMLFLLVFLLLLPCSQSSLPCLVFPVCPFLSSCALRTVLAVSCMPHLQNAFSALDLCFPAILPLFLSSLAQSASLSRSTLFGSSPHTQRHVGAPTFVTRQEPLPGKKNEATEL